MDLDIEPKSTCGLYETPLLHQTTFWSAVKREQGVPSRAFDIRVRADDIGCADGRAPYLVDDLLILFQQVGPDATVGYIPYGPALRPEDECKGIFLEELSESLRANLPKSCFMLRYDLPWESLWAHDENNYGDDGRWLGPPEPDLQETRINWGTRMHNLRKATTDILPADTVFLDMARDEQDILASMKPKTRYNIHLARRRGVRVRTGTFSDLDIFYELYRQTCLRNGITLHHRSFFEAMFVSTDPGPGASDGTTDFDLLVAESDGFPLAALFVVYASNRGTYLFGASSSQKRNLMGTYALQWEAMVRAKARGCTEYDLFGTPPNADPGHPMHGLYRFKTGFGGSELHRMGCWDYPLDRDAYRGFTAKEMTARGYHRR